MAPLTGHLTRPAVSGYGNPYLSRELRELTPERYEPVVYSLGRLHARPLQYTGPGVSVSSIVHAPRMARSSHDDFYNRIRVRPQRLNLGNLATSQVRPLTLWNAFVDQAQVLATLTLVDGAGLTVSPRAALPLPFTPMQEHILDVAVDANGPAVIDARVDLGFTGLDGVSVQVTGLRMIAWPVPCDWSRPVDESLTFLTDIHYAYSGSRTATPLRAAPRRSIGFDVVEWESARRVLESMLYDWSARVWSLPIWPDISLLSAPVAEGALEVPVATAGLDFAAGSMSMLWRGVSDYELVEVAEVLGDRLRLARPTTRAWSRGTRLYPCRNARLVTAPSIRRLSGAVVRLQARFDIDEPCDWSAIAPAATYLGHPVLEHRSDENTDPEAAFERRVSTLDGDVGLVAVQDQTELAWQRVSHAWRLQGRAARAAWRSLAYWLDGRAGLVWIPTMTDDLVLLEAVTAVGEALTVEWSGAARFLRLQDGRRHIRIALRSGQVLYRRVSAVNELDIAREQLLLDAPLGVAIAPRGVQMISWMTLSHLASDTVELSHVTDSQGLADARVSFVAAGREEP
ncbi:hypothetical protein [Luteimonas fraxinea]|uniref:Phage tail protein n=1 Tax=Luteimonas fraxinea TaxID=2901869 RepID=A0ABS8UEE2_9GAMM|nr:hypothetical protein [Luteimonas fraxinea]MCD9097038.1 hypothetical protein [Luteimonas fraxinea]